MKRKQLLVPIIVIILMIVIIFGALISRSIKRNPVSEPEDTKAAESETMVNDTDVSDTKASDYESDFSEVPTEMSFDTEETASGAEDIMDEDNGDNSQTLDDYVVELDEDESFEID